MNNARASDYLAIVNGPEDGKEFPLVRSPFQIGYEADCAVCIQLDRTVQPIHAQVRAVSGGYSIRSMTPSQVFVGGKRVGMFRSRTLKPGQRMQVGKTVFILRCVRGGLASKSRGLGIESDLTWAAKQLGKKALSLLLGLVMTVPRFLLQNWRIGLIAVVVIALVVSPWLRAWTFYWVEYAVYRVRQLF